MANALFDKGAEKILAATVNLTSDTIKVSLVRTSGTWTPALTTDEFFDEAGSDVASNDVGTAQTLGSKTFGTIARTFDAADVTFTSVAAGAAIQSLVIWKDTGTPTTSPLIAFIDTGTGLPVTPDGNNIDVAWNASGIITL